MRSLLTSLGILIGVGALIVTVGIGTGTRTSIGKGLTRLGTNLITVTPGTVVVNGISLGLGARTTLTMDDVRALSDPAVARHPRGGSARHPRRGDPQGRVATWTTRSSGRPPTVLPAYARYIGRATCSPTRTSGTRAHVAVIGQTTANSLFPDGNALDDVIQIDHAPFQVIGILSVVGATGSTIPTTSSWCR